MVAVEEEAVAARFGSEPATAFLARLHAARPPQPPLPATAIDEILLLESWLRRHREAPGVLLLPAPSAAAQAEAVEELALRVRLVGGG
jgi:hypothetical protein